VLRDPRGNYYGGTVTEDHVTTVEMILIWNIQITIACT